MIACLDREISFYSILYFTIFPLCYKVIPLVGFESIAYFPCLANLNYL